MASRELSPSAGSALESKHTPGPWKIISDDGDRVISTKTWDTIAAIRAAIAKAEGRS